MSGVLVVLEFIHVLLSAVISQMFSYYSGQTGSGKTFTMLGECCIALFCFVAQTPSFLCSASVLNVACVLSLGPSDFDNFTDDQRGVIPRSFEYLFFLINREVERVSRK